MVEQAVKDAEVNAEENGQYSHLNNNVYYNLS